MASHDQNGEPRIRQALAAIKQSLLQCIQHEVSAHGAAHAPTHNFSDKHIDDERNEQPALPRVHVREVRYPQLVGPSRIELPIDPVQWARG